MSISFTYCGVACGVISIDNQFHIGIDPDLSPKGTLVPFKGFVSEKQTDVHNDKSLLNKVDVWLITHGHQDHLERLPEREDGHFSQQEILRWGTMLK